MMKTAMQLVKTFVVAAFLALVAQLILVGWTTLIMPGGDAFAISMIEPLSLVSMGVVGGLLYLPRIYDKLEQQAGLGAVLPFSGFCVAIAHTVEDTKQQTGSTGKAVQAGFKTLLLVIGTGSAGCFIIGACAVFANATLPPISGASASLAQAQASMVPLSVSSPEMFVGAVLLGATLCTVFQVFMLYTNLPVPKVLILALMVGGLLTPAGMMTSFAMLGGLGVNMLAVGAGSAVTATTMALFAGNAVPLITVMCVFIALTILGCIWGLIRSGKR
jgi:hypothetical protein